MAAADRLADSRAEMERQRTATQSRIAALRRSLDDIVDSADLANVDDEHDPEGATIAFERAQIASLLDQERRHLDALDAAAARMDAGTFGVCRECNRAIAAERLATLPAADRCAVCAGARRLRRRR
jgi:RNA polymerase-binding transcription factor DksA